MIPSFTDPYPDELLYSAFARFSERHPSFTTRMISKMLLGEEQATAVHDLPSRLQNFLNNLPDGHVYTLDRLVGYHTLFPYYAAFQPPDQIQTALEIMASTGSNRLNAILGSLLR